MNNYPCPLPCISFGKMIKSGIMIAVFLRQVKQIPESNLPRERMVCQLEQREIKGCPEPGFRNGEIGGAFPRHFPASIIASPLFR
jgi:hypothetical protein